MGKVNASPSPSGGCIHFVRSPAHPCKLVRNPILSSRNGFGTLKTMKTTYFIVLGVVAFLCLVAQTGTATSLQYRSNNFVFDTDSATWPSVDGSLSLTAVHAATNGWVLPEKYGRSVFFGNSVTSPLGFPDSATFSSPPYSRPSASTPEVPSTPFFL